MRTASLESIWVLRSERPLKPMTQSSHFNQTQPSELSTPPHTHTLRLYGSD